MRSVAILSLVAGCSFAPKPAAEDAQPGGDATDAPDAPPGVACVGAGAFQICAPDVPIDTLDLTGDLDTDHDTRCNTTPITGNWTTANQPAACIIVAKTITIENLSTHGGGHVMVIVATESMTISGLLDASSHAAGGHKGPGINDTSGCPAFGRNPGNQAGGAGGTFMTAGGAGGAHDGDKPGLPSTIPPTPTVLRPGCGGQGAGNQSGGQGGGAIYLAAGGTITLQPAATVNASGRSGSSVSGSQGGPGGGSGGMIVLAAASISGAGAQILANGAGGVAGSNTVGSNVGQEPTVATVQAAGGIGTGANGGAGFARAGADLPATAGLNGGGPAGGGGGGGGAGYIVATPTPSGPTISPSPS